MESIDFIKSSKINFIDALIRLDQPYELQYETELEPSDYVSFAKKDLQSEKPRGIINAITNSKRAIDCLLYNLNIFLGYSNEKLNENNSFNEYINDVLTNKQEQSYNFKILDVFELVPFSMASNIRQIRNSIEHEYNIPDESEAINAVEISEMFYRSIEHRISKMGDIEITDIERSKDRDTTYITGIFIRKEDDYISLFCDKKEIKTNSNDVLYPYLIKLMLELSDYDKFKDAYKKLIGKIYPEIPYNNIKCENPSYW